MNQGQRKNLAALVTGGSRGIGRAIALRLASTNARTVIVNYLQNDKEAERTRSMIVKRKSTCVLARANLSEPSDIDKLFETVKATVGHLDIFVHCAALNTFKPLSQIKPNQWDLTVNINARSFLQCVQLCSRLMKNGTIIAISSIGSVRTVPNYGAMGPTKSALEALVRYLAVELAPQGIRVNGVSGGLIETDSLDKFPEPVRLREEVIARTPAGRLGTPEDIADVVLFLTSPAAKWIYGQIIVADGGISLV